MRVGRMDEKMFREMLVHKGDRELAITAAVQAMVQEHPVTESLIRQVAQFVCNASHSGIDVWSMIRDQPDRVARWMGMADAMIKNMKDPR